MTAGVRPVLLLALWSVISLVALTSVNVANMSLSASVLRSKELAVRAALGSSRVRLIVGLLFEGLIVASAASGLALVCVWLSLDKVRELLPTTLALTGSISINGRVFAFAAGSAFVSALLFGTIPALQASRRNLIDHLTERRHPLGKSPDQRRWFLIVQVAFVTVLAVSAGLAITSFVRVTRADLGFSRHGLLTAPITGAIGSPADVEAMVRAIPGVTSAAMISGGAAPLRDGGSATTTLRLPGAHGAAVEVTADFRRVSAAYFATAGIKVLRGRTFVPSEKFGQAIVVDELAARAIGADVEVPGATVLMPGSKAPVAIVGIVSHIKGAGPEKVSGPQVYSPLDTAGGTLLVRSDDPASTAGPLNAAIQREWPGTARGRSVVLLDDAFSRLIEERRTTTLVMATFALLALMVAAAGVYAVIAVEVEQRRHEFGVRSALGSSSGRIVRLVVIGAMAPILFGTLAGWTATSILAYRNQEMLFQTSPFEPTVYLTVSAAILSAGLLSAITPARRAGTADPLVALRHQ